MDNIERVKALWLLRRSVDALHRQLQDIIEKEEKEIPEQVSARNKELHIQHGVEYEKRKS